MSSELRSKTQDTRRALGQSCALPTSTHLHARKTRPASGRRAHALNSSLTQCFGRLALTRSLGNWFEQKVIESGCKEGAGPAIAPFEKEGLPFQKPGETTQFHNRYMHMQIWLVSESLAATRATRQTTMHSLSPCAVNTLWRADEEDMSPSTPTTTSQTQSTWAHAMNLRKKAQGVVQTSQTCPCRERDRESPTLRLSPSFLLLLPLSASLFLSH